MASQAEKHEIRRKALEELAGDKAPDLLSSPENAACWLTNDDPKMRIAALSVLSREFPQWEKLQKACERVFASDPDQSVRLQAKLCLAALFQRNSDPRARRLFAEFVNDDSISDEMRMSYYILLLSTLGILSESEPKRFPNDIQWAIVNRELHTG